MQIRKRKTSDITNLSLRKIRKTSLPDNEAVRTNSVLKKSVMIGQNRTSNQRNTRKLERKHKRCNHSEGVCLRTRKKLLRKSSCPEKLHTLYSERLKPPSVLHLKTGDEKSLLKQRFSRKHEPQGNKVRISHISPVHQNMLNCSDNSNMLSTKVFNKKLSPYVNSTVSEDAGLLSQTVPMMKEQEREDSVLLAPYLEDTLTYIDQRSPRLENKLSNSHAFLNDYSLTETVENAAHLSQDIIPNSTVYDSRSHLLNDGITTVIHTPERQAQYEVVADECSIDILDNSAASSFVNISDVICGIDDVNDDDDVFERLTSLSQFKNENENNV